MGLTGFVRVLLGFTGFVRVLLGFTGFDLVLQGSRVGKIADVHPSLKGKRDAAFQPHLACRSVLSLFF